jgi:O-antigen ligase
MLADPMTSRSLPSWVASPPALALVSALVAVTLAEVMYRLSPTYAAAIMIAPVVVGLVAWRPALGIYGALLAIPLETAGTSVGSSTVTPAKGLLVLTAACVLPRIVLETPRRRLHLVHVWFLGLLALSIAGLTFAPDSHAVLVITGNAFAYLLISIYVSRMDRNDLQRLLTVLVISGGLVGALTIASSGSPSAASTASDSARAQLGFDSPNVLAFYLLLTLGPTLAMLADAGSTRARRVLAVVVAPLTLVGLVLTQSRTGIIGAGVVVLVLLSSSRFRRYAAVTGLALLLVVAFNFGTVLKSPALSAVQQRLASISSLGGVQQDPRVQIWKTTPQIIANHPLLGVGEGNFPAISAGYGLLAFDLTPIDHAHDIFLTVAAELGLIGLAVFVGFLYTLVRTIRRALVRSTSERMLVLGVASSFTGMLFACLGDYPPRTPTILATMLIMVGIVLALARQQGSPTGSTREHLASGERARSA